MRIKKFTGHTLKEATELMKSELGPDAIVLSSRKVPRGGPLSFLGRDMFEITGAMDEAALAGENTYRRRPEGRGFDQYLRESRQGEDDRSPMAGIRRIAEEFEHRGHDDRRAPASSRRGVESAELLELKTDMEDLKGTLRVIADHLKYSRMPALPDFLQKAYTRLVQHDLDERLAADVVQAVYGRLAQEQGATKSTMEKQLIGTLAGLITAPAPPRSRRKNQKVIVLVGPTGVGKTTTIAKLAAINKLMHGHDVGLISADTYRIGAIEQLRTFAGIADIPMQVVYKPSEVGPALRKFRSKDMVFVDTVGRSQRSRKELADLGRFVAAADPDEIHLVISASTGVRTAQDILNQFKGIKPDRLIFSKLDEAATYGPILSLLHAHRLPVSYVTTGQTVPDDIRTMDPTQLASLVYTGELAHA